MLSRYEGRPTRAATGLRGRGTPPPRLRRGGRSPARRVVRRHPVPHRHRPEVRRHAPGVHPAFGHPRRVDARRVRHPRRHRGSDREHRPRSVLRPGSPVRARGESMLVDADDGDRVVIRGTVVTDDEGADRRRDARLLAERHRRVLRRAAAGRSVGGEPARHLHDRRRRHVRAPDRPPGAVPDPVRRPRRRSPCAPTAGAGCGRATRTCG